jgi:hypothetical protein
VKRNPQRAMASLALIVWGLFVILWVVSGAFPRYQWLIPPIALAPLLGVAVDRSRSRRFRVSAGILYGVILLFSIARLSVG